MRQVVLPTALVLTLCNMDRICMSVAMPVMARELAWAPSTQVCAARRSPPGRLESDRMLTSACAQGIVQSAFLWGYTITQVLGGSLADRHGGKPQLALIAHDASVQAAALCSRAHPQSAACQACSSVAHSSCSAATSHTADQIRPACRYTAARAAQVRL